MSKAKGNGSGFQSVLFESLFVLTFFHSLEEFLTFHFFETNVSSFLDFHFIHFCTLDMGTDRIRIFCNGALMRSYVLILYFRLTYLIR